jgi:large subunit ribosomal protein L35
MSKPKKKYKLKTHSGAKRRFNFTASGKIQMAKGMKSHLRRRKSPRVKRQFDRMQPVDESLTTRVKRLLPYGN